ncbi:MAG: thioredoxin family protein [Desulfonatronovibrionaceae bacterium]
MKKFAAIAVFIGAVFAIMFLYTAQQQKQEEASRQSLPEIPSPDTVTFVNLGSDSCVPCQIMEPVIQELQADYQGQALITYVDIDIHPEQGRRYGIKTIPTQIFFNHQGREVLRHQGIMDRESIVEILDQLLNEAETASAKSFTADLS